MQRLWSAEELVERWSLASGDLALLPGKADGGKLGFAVQLTFYKQHAIFPDDEADIAPAVIAHIAAQIGVPIAMLDEYDWTGRTGRRHRQLILDFLAVASRIPSFLDWSESIGEGGDFGQHGGEPLDQRQQPHLGHGGDQLVEHAALSEQRMGASLAGV